ncbi:uncharacterized protein [Lolium perenne]|uniref:uncharacterized protein n=1 Tax=Lolium perenne TaxID=4522 RepID=UPI0021EAC182|nr:dof zinc finger protein DOF3.1-like [Lolium perenne]
MAPFSSPSLLPSSGANKRPALAADASDPAEDQLPLPQDDGVAAGNNNKREQLECPRCRSRNTKFCYYNNYSTNQPRHFCRVCRRYWTHGGTLRNVPVGGACRRAGNGNGSNKRRRSDEPAPSPSPSPSSPPAYRAADAPPGFPFLTDGAFLPHFDFGLGSAAAAPAGSPWMPASSSAPGLDDGLTAPWGGAADGTLPGSGVWDDFTTGLDLTWPPPPPPPPAAGN